RDAPGRARRRVAHGDTIWSTVRPNLRAHALVLEPGKEWVASTGFAVLTPVQVPFSYLYLLITQDQFVSYLTGQATGSAYPAVTGRTFAEATVLRPPELVLERFHAIVGPLLTEAETLKRTSTVASSARDLLLPRLISGEVDVEELDIPIGEAAA
ncbi:MAG: restriction endonuclease subunit S, partial [Candidatus Dormibacteria bacterium]